MEEKSMNRIELDFDEEPAEAETAEAVETVTTEDVAAETEFEASESKTTEDTAEDESEAAENADSETSETDETEAESDEENDESETHEEPAAPQVKLAEVSVEQFYRNTNTYPAEGSGPLEASVCPRCGYVLALKCPNCHSVCDRRAKYCSECGTKLPERDRKMFVIAGGLFGF